MSDPIPGAEAGADQLLAAYEEVGHWHSPAYAFSPELQDWVEKTVAEVTSDPEHQHVAPERSPGSLGWPGLPPLSAPGVLRAGEVAELVAATPATLRGVLLNMTIGTGGKPDNGVLVGAEWKCDRCEHWITSPALRPSIDHGKSLYGGWLFFARGQRIVAFAVCGRCRRNLDRDYPDGLCWLNLKPITMSDALNALITGTIAP